VPAYPLSAAQRGEIGNLLRGSAPYKAFIEEMNLLLFGYFFQLYRDPANAPNIRQIMEEIRTIPGSNIAALLVNEALEGIA
jgi:hypothetical protein